MRYIPRLDEDNERVLAKAARSLTLPRDHPDALDVIGFCSYFRRPGDPMSTLDYELCAGPLQLMEEIAIISGSFITMRCCGSGYNVDVSPCGIIRAKRPEAKVTYETKLQRIFIIDREYPLPEPADTRYFRVEMPRLVSRYDHSGADLKKAPLMRWIAAHKASVAWRVLRQHVRMRRATFYWWGLAVERQCAPGGSGRTADLGEFQEWNASQMSA